VTVERLDAGEDLAVIPTRNEDLGARSNGGLEDGEWTGGKLMLFDLRNFVLGQLLTGLREQLLDLGVNHVGN